MTERDIYRFTEKCLYDYKKNLARIKALTENLALLRVSGDVKAQNYQYTFTFTGEKSDPVLSFVQKVNQIENEISRLINYTTPITRLHEDLNASYALVGSKNTDYKRILELFYFGGNSITQILIILHWSRGTFFNRRRSLVNCARGYLGF